MTVLRDISFLWSMLHIIVLFLLLFEPRYSWKSTLIAAFAGWTVLLVINVPIMVWMGHSFIMRVAFFSCTIPSAVLFFLLSKYRDGRFFFLFCLTDTVSFWLMQITNFFDRLTGNTYIIMFATRIILFLLMDLVFWKSLRKPYLDLQRKLDKDWWLFAAIGGLYYLLIMVTSVPVSSPMPDTIGLVRIILVLLLMPLTYLTVLRSLWRQMRESQSQKELELMAARDELRWENLRILQNSSAALAQARHDILGNLGILQALSHQGEYEKLDEYLARITQQTSEILPLKITGHSIANAILTQGAERIKEAGAKLHYQVELPDTLTIPDEDLAAFLMNLVNNAIDAIKEIPRERSRWVEITIHIRDRYLFIEGRNPYERSPDPDNENGRFLSHKGAGHGYGLKIMENVAHRYQSELQIETKDSIFLVRTALLMPQSEQE